MKVTKRFHFYIYHTYIKSTYIKINFHTCKRSVILFNAVRSSLIFVLHELQEQLVKCFCFVKFISTEKLSIGNFSELVCQLERYLFTTTNHETTTMILSVKPNKGTLSFHRQLTSSKRYLQAPPANISLFKVKKRNTRKRCEICLMLTIKAPKRRQWLRSGVFIANFERILHFFLVFILLTLSR